MKSGVGGHGISFPFLLIHSFIGRSCVVCPDGVDPHYSLLEDLQPPVNPAKMIDDPEDKKPENWVCNNLSLDGS